MKASVLTHLHPPLFGVCLKEQTKVADDSRAIEGGADVGEIYYSTERIDERGEERPQRFRER
jgi:hypothetical protein